MSKLTLSALMVMQTPILLASPIQADSTRTIALEDVMVVSTPKEAGAMRQQPSSVSLLSARRLESAHVTSLKGVAQLVPNLFIPDYGSRLTSAVYIRGIGSRINTPAVGMYVDNVPYIDKSAFDFNFYDVERIDVLRGPQGTLYGRNAMGGIIRVYTRNPFNYQGTDLHLGAASGNGRYTLSMSHYHRPSDSFAFSVAGYYEGADGFYKNSFTGEHVDKMQSGGGRIRGLYKPTERLSLDLHLGYDYSDEGAYPYYYTGSLDLSNSTNATENDPYQDYVGQIANNRRSSYRRGLLNAGLDVQYEANNFTLNAITGYQHMTDRMFMDQDFLPADIYTLEQRQRIHTLNEEVVMKSRSGRRWEWVSGLNLMYQWLHTTGPVTFYEDGIQWLSDNINSNLPQKPAMSIGLSDNELQIGGRFETPTFNAALFHQSTLHLTNRLSASLGLRVDYEHNQLDYSAPSTINYGFSMPQMRIDLQGLSAHIDEYEGSMDRNTWQLLPKVALKYDLSSQSNIYLSVAKGMRSGGYNLQMFSDLIQGAMQKKMMDGVKEAVFDYLDANMPPAMADKLKPTIAGAMPEREMPTVEQVVFKPEHSLNYEVGTHLTLPEAGIQFDAALYWSEITDQQIARFAPSGLGRMMVNAGESRSIGGEMSLLWRPIEPVAFALNYGYTHATFQKYDDGSEADYSGNYVPFVPQHTLGTDLSYTWQLPLAWAHNLTLGATYNGSGRIYWTESNLTGDGLRDACQDFYGTLAARLQLTMRRATLQLWARNLTDTRYNAFYFESASRGFEQHGKPRQVGIEVKFHF